MSMKDYHVTWLNKIRNLISIFFAPGLARTLFYRFILISILPMSFVAWISIQNSINTINGAQVDKLAAIAKAKHNHLSAYFNSTITNLRLQAELENTVKFLEAMKLAYRTEVQLSNQTEQSLSKITKGYQWALLEEEFAADFLHFQTTFDYIDTLLLDNNGNILYSIRKDSDFGSNVYTKENKDNLFSKTVKKAMETGTPVYSDMQIYRPYNNQISSFLMQAVVDEYGDKLGVLAIHLSLSPIQEVMKDNTGLGNTGETFLIGDDLLMRSNSRFSADSSILSTDIDIQNSHYLFEPEKGVSASSMQEYRGYRGTHVYGVQLPILFAGVKMKVIAEIEKSEALKPTRVLLIRVLIVVLITIFIVIFLSILSTRTIVTPITKLTLWAQNLAEGHLTKEIIKTPNNEIGILNNTFNGLVDSFIQVTSMIKALSVGDLTKKVKPRSENDVLVQTLNQLNIALQSVVEQADEIGKGNYDTEILSRSENDVLGTALQLMTHNLRTSKLTNQRQNWLKTSLAEIAEILSGENETDQLACDISRYFAKLFNAHTAVLFTVNAEANNGYLLFNGGYAFDESSELKKCIKFGEGLLGQCAVEQEILVLENIPNNNLYVSSSTTKIKTTHIIVAPLITNKMVKGVIELGGFDQIKPEHLELLKLSSDVIAVAFELSYNLKQTRKLLETTQQQQTELANYNTALKDQTDQLKDSENKLKEKSLILSEINEELSARGEILEKQKSILEKAKKETEEKAEALEEASKYKSEFLANMSHELRTPLNSLLILAGILAKNEEGNLTDDDVESAEVILDSGNHLLNLINEILDLSKVESGQMLIMEDEVVLNDLKSNFESRFSHMAKDKSIHFEVQLSDELPANFLCDLVKLNQIINNLISNAIKFTNQGSIKLMIHKKTNKDCLAGLDEVMAFSVIDTGIGIEKSKQGAIFGAFQQADGSTSRTHGGTGLGLSISLSFAHLLGGDIDVKSSLGDGSCFSLYLPLDKSKINNKYTEQSKDKIETNFQDDRNKINENISTLLIVEDDFNFAKIVFDECKKQNCQAIIASNGEEGLLLLKKFNFTGIILDYMLPDLTGKDILIELKKDPKTENIPVHIVSALDNSEGLDDFGEINQAVKPISHDKMIDIIQSLSGGSDSAIKVLIVEDDTTGLFALKKLFKNENVLTEGVQTAQSAIVSLRHQEYQVMILDLGLPDFSGIDLLDFIDEDQAIKLPEIVIHTGRDLSEPEKQKLYKYTDRIVIKSSHSHDKLLSAVHWFVEKVTAVDLDVISFETEVEPKLLPLEKDKNELSNELATSNDNSDVDDNTYFDGKSILIVDDDMRNTFALAKVLRSKRLNVQIASSGEQCLSLLEEENSIRLILMDIMMPVMDGYETMNLIRKEDKFSTLNIIAVTANAMPGDEDKCIKAGANAYISKPIDIDKLMIAIKSYV